MEELLAEMRQHGIRLSLDDGRLRVQGVPPAMSDRLRSAIAEHRNALIALLRGQAAGASAAAPLRHDAAARHEPFALTPLQHAYWLGRDPALELGGVATHLYLEFACEGMDPARLEEALCRLVERHDMLRAVLDATEPRQRVLAEVPAYRIAVTDARALAPADAQAAALATREVLSHQVLAPDRWPLFDVRATLMPGGELRLHLSLDLLVLDGSSIHLLLVEWRALLEGRPLPPPPAISFRDVAIARAAARQGAAATAARAYWEERLATLPGPPQLPLRPQGTARREPPRFSRRALQLDAARWTVLKRVAAGSGVSPSGLVLAAFADVLARWSRSAHFTLTLTTGFRDEPHPDIHRVLGDFTAVVLHEVDRSRPAESLTTFAARQQQRLAQDLKHRAHDGMEVRRDWARRHGVAGQAAAPVVFSSGLGWGGEEGWNLEQLGRCVHAISQTSQVWLDCHATELHGALMLAWDAVDALFQPGVLDAMFESFGGLVDTLADWAAQAPEDNAHAGAAASAHAPPSAALPPAMQARRDEANRSALPLPQQPLHAAIVEQALRRPERPALLAGGRALSFGQWLGEATALAQHLLDAGLQPGEPVAIVMRKGWEQAVAALGVLLARGAYVPIDADLPPLRQQALLQACGARQVLVQPGGPAEALPAGPWQPHVVHAGTVAAFGPAHAPSLHAAADLPAYVIFTSGTTGTPKGVVIDHRGASNTVLAVNRLLGVAEGDTVLGLSSLAFDLSVYDLFGVPGAGGRLVLPEAGRAHDPEHWAELMGRHGVTLWNSAPQLMRMLLDTQAPGAALPGALRAVLLSGDFMPLDTLARLRGHGCPARLYSLGGATEASIWSVLYEVQAIDPGWASIPYGRPLPNQQAWVLDGLLRPAPDHARGRIFLGGPGLAQGYLGDAQRTAERFIHHPVTGERLYDTGDIGCYDDGGNIVILGREDGQVKIRGHRIELGEIEAVLQRHAAVDQACAVATGAPGGPRALAVFAQLRDGFGSTTAADLRDHLARHLPEAMLPQRLGVLPRLPVSANGKVDRRALAELPPDDAASAAAAPAAGLAPRSGSERLVAAAWARVLPGVAIGLADNFFDVGGDSVLATELLRELNRALPVPVQMHELFENLTIEALARWVDERQREAACSPTPAAAARSAGTGLADAQQLAADVALLRDALPGDDDAAPAGTPENAPTAPAPQHLLLTGATGWVGAHLLAELLRATAAHVTCVVRAAGAADARERVLAALRRVAPGLDSAALERVRALPGRIEAPAFDLPSGTWGELCASVDGIYHLAGTSDVARDYAHHRRTNVLPLLELLQLAGSTRRKPVVVLSPATVCRRLVHGQPRVLAEPRVHADPEGLRTAYAQSKWVAEQALWDAAAHGLPVRIYRSARALPAAATGLAPEGDACMAALQAAARAGMAPPWPEARLHGLPVDQLCRRLVADALQQAGASAVVHLDPADPPALADVLALLRRPEPEPEPGPMHGVAGNEPAAPGPMPATHGEVAATHGACPSTVATHDAAPPASAAHADALQAWLDRCREAAAALPPASATLAALLFERRDGVAAVEVMFGAPGLSTGAPAATPAPAEPGPGSAAYWQRVRSAHGPAAAA